MAADLTRDDVAKVAHLARLTLSEEELDLFTEQLRQILTHAEDIAALDLEGVEATAHPYGLINVVRSDDVRVSLNREEVLACAPDAREGCFAVPRIMGEAP
ncbi:MAG TPA: Asp-tRNA(Asn)/Glu-tRNA(Gln) amidotransferase subunit GatC [Acidimicrobiales bacterium]|nr:Asp-tRNA(Asn)/Glu-tRNA(Gln) amidotransferase subunit GatC [Acidimicrobiales bacterium]